MIVIFPTAFERFKGVTFGTAIGDSLGFPCEFNKEIQPMKELTKGMLFSDDTQMYMATCLGLLDVGGAFEGRPDRAVLEDTGAAIAKRYVEWSVSPENNRAPGGACMYGCHQLAGGTPWREAGKPLAGGCGTAMRSMAYGQRFFGYPESYKHAGKYAAEHALMTHRHAMAQAAAAAVAAGVSMLGKESSKEEVVKEMVAAAYVYDEETANMIKTGEQLALSKDATPSGVLNDWRGWAGHEAVAASVFCFVRYDNFKDAVLTAVNSPGDSDSLGAITGALAGGFYGISGIPGDWVFAVEDYDRLLKLNDRMWQAFVATETP